MFKVTVSPVAKLSVPLSVSVSVRLDQHADVGPDRQVAPLVTVKLPAKT